LKATERKLMTLNPATEEILNEYDIMTKEKINESVRRAREAFSDWKKDIHNRADSLYAFAREFRKNRENLARTSHRKWGRQSKNQDLK